uniref:Uncharacterized protein n=1 Tax=Aegilops tauschii subsp. strangulata TaxID=200361 RepID=A0A453PMJ8_AEGTS
SLFVSCHTRMAGGRTHAKCWVGIMIDLHLLCLGILIVIGLCSIKSVDIWTS